jgi:hypothetical protein
MSRNERRNGRNIYTEFNLHTLHLTSPFTNKKGREALSYIMLLNMQEWQKGLSILLGHLK